MGRQRELFSSLKLIGICESVALKRNLFDGIDWVWCKAGPRVLLRLRGAIGIMRMLPSHT